MRITFLGTGTSHGVPMIACDCATCRSADPRDTRLRPSILLEFDGLQVLVDAGPDLRAQALRHRIARVDAILFTHGHADHILGMDDVRRFNAVQAGAMPCYGDAATLVDIRRMFAYVFDPATPKGGGLPHLELVEILGPFCMGRREVRPVPLWHGRRGILGFRVDGFAYLTDCSAIPDESWPLLEHLDVVVLDALRDRPHPTHFTLDEAVAAARRIGARTSLFTHMCHDLPHAATCARLPAGMALAYDGQVIDL
ncbi:MAG TPA: MBL fold metallo-hydrolase [Vicinamibacterales bacterium]|nr:MBL fold metallo-hydrolase [Vicinamibacterales bacterium]